VRKGLVSTSFRLNVTPLILRFVLCLALGSGVVLAKDDDRTFKWLSQDQEKALAETVPPPPGSNSPEDQADLAKVLEAQKARTADSVAECERDKGFSYKLMESVYGSNWTADTAPKFHDLLKTMLAVTRFVNDTAK
jgi:hypothetical protein